MSTPPTRQLENYLIALDDLCHLASLSDLYASIYPEALSDVKRIKHSVCEGVSDGLTEEDRLCPSALAKRFEKALERHIARLSHAIDRVIVATRHYARPHPEKDIIEHSIDAARDNVIRHQVNRDDEWLARMTLHPELARADRIALQNVFASKVLTSHRTHQQLYYCAAILDALEEIAALDASHSSAFDMLNEAYGFHAERIYITEAVRSSSASPLDHQDSCTQWAIHKLPPLPKDDDHGAEDAVTVLAHIRCDEDEKPSTSEFLEIAARYAHDQDENRENSDLEAYTIELLRASRPYAPEMTACRQMLLRSARRLGGLSPEECEVQQTLQPSTPLMAILRP